jgi:hypothetical protein
MDLLFSPHVAFIWDDTQRAIVWMNAAARGKLALSLDGLLDALPKRLIRKFARYFEKAGSGRTMCRAIKLKIPPHPAFDFCLDALELASGHRGLVVVEAGAPQSIPVPRPPRKASAKGTPAKLRPILKKSRAAAGRTLKRPEITGPQLTAEELRSFKAIGRAVRKLCHEKRHGAAPALPHPVALPPDVRKRPSGSRTHAPSGLPFSAFDTVFLLDKKLQVASIEGRTQCLGWRKADLIGRAAGQLLLAGEQVFFLRMVSKLNNTAAEICRDTIMVADGAGNGVPCRAVLGYWAAGSAYYFLALIVLKAPQRLKKFQYQPINPASIARLAA